MDRGKSHRTYRRTLTIAIGLSVAVHLVALAWLKLTVPVFEETEPGRALQIVELADDWDEQAIDVIPLETALDLSPTAEAAGGSTGSAGPEGLAPGAAGAEPAVAAPAPVTDLPDAIPSRPAMTLALAEVEAEPVMEVALARSSRGVIQKTASAGASGPSGFDFVATSDAARDAERESGGGDRGGIGAGGCPTWGGIPLFVPPTGGLGGVPMQGKGRGILGARPPTSEAINRFGPRLGGGF